MLDLSTNIEVDRLLQRKERTIVKIMNYLWVGLVLFVVAVSLLPTKAYAASSDY